MERNKYTNIMNKYRTMFNDNLNKDDILNMCSTAIITSILNITNEHVTCSHFVIALDDHAPNADVITIIIDSTSPKYTKITVKYVNEIVKSLELCDDCLYENTIQVDIDSISVKSLDSWGEKVVKRISEEFAYAHTAIEFVSGVENILDYIKNNKEKENSEMSYMSFKEFMEQHPEDESIIDVLKKCKDKGIKATIDAMCTIVSELDKKINELSDKIHSDEEDDVDNEEDGCYYCPGPCCNGCINGSGCDDEEEDDDEDLEDEEDFECDIGEYITNNITSALLMSLHQKVINNKSSQKSISIDIAKEFMDDVFSNTNVRFRENKLTINIANFNRPFNGSYELEVYDRTTGAVVWSQKIDISKLSPGMIKVYNRAFQYEKCEKPDLNIKGDHIEHFDSVISRTYIFNALADLLDNMISCEGLGKAIIANEKWEYNTYHNEKYHKVYSWLYDVRINPTFIRKWSSKDATVRNLIESSITTTIPELKED